MPRRQDASRSVARPWPPTGLTTRAWLQLPIVLVPITALTTTQAIDPAHVDAKLDGAPSWTGDPCVHVIDWNHRYWLEDGHHRVHVAIIRAESHIHARIWPPTH